MIPNNAGHRRSIRFPDYDYSTPGLYSVTICTKNKACLFGRIVDGQLQLNSIGKLVSLTCSALPEMFPQMHLDIYVVMPNHLHGVIAILKDRQQLNKGAASSAPTKPPPTLGNIIRAFKSVSAVGVNKALHRTGIQVWQRNYFEHVIRSGDALNKIRRYIGENPSHWVFDAENPRKKNQSPSPDLPPTLKGLRIRP